MISDAYLDNFYFIDPETNLHYNKTYDEFTWEDIQWKDMENEDFIIWMRTAGLPNFRKIWGKIDKADLISGFYKL